MVENVISWYAALTSEVNSFFCKLSTECKLKKTKYSLGYYLGNSSFISEGVLVLERGKIQLNSPSSHFVIFILVLLIHFLFPIHQ